MKSVSRRRLVVLAIVLAMGFSPKTAFSNHERSAYTIGVDSQGNPKSFRINESSTLVSWAWIPESFDRSSDDLDFYCAASAIKIKDDDYTYLANAKGKYTSELWILDVSSGTSERSKISSGSIKTDENGNAGWLIDLDPSAISGGGVVALIHTEFDWTNKKRANQVQLQCSSYTSPRN